nr:unnamed protein product [Spirometra erinaceieuropaei]
MRTHPYSTFVDLTKALNAVNREGLCKAIQKFDCPKQFTQMVRQLHDGMMARIADNGPVSEALAVINRTKKDCVIAPTLFSLMSSTMLMCIYRDERPGVLVAYRTGGHLLNQRRTHFRSRVSSTTAHQLLLTYDCALYVTSEGEMKRSMEVFVADAACDNFGLVINTKETAVIHQPQSDNAYVPSQINVNCTQLQAVDKFAYLGSTLSLATPKWTMKCPAGSPKPGKLLPFCKTPFGIDTISTSAPN